MEDVVPSRKRGPEEVGPPDDSNEVAEKDGVHKTKGDLSRF